MVFQAIYEKCQDYYDQIPADTLKKMAISAVSTFTVTFIFSKKIPTEPYNLGRPLFAAGVATLASLVYALTTPLFNMIFEEERLQFHRECTKQVVNIALNSILVSYFTASKINVLALPLLGSLSINLIKSLFDVVPSVAETWFNDPVFADELREIYKDWGVDAPAGTSSVFINFGIFPAIGFVE
jgi:hypothetical protein